MKENHTLLSYLHCQNLEKHACQAKNFSLEMKWKNPLSPGYLRFLLQTLLKVEDPPTHYEDVFFLLLTRTVTEVLLFRIFSTSSWMASCNGKPFMRLNSSPIQIRKKIGQIQIVHLQKQQAIIRIDKDGKSHLQRKRENDLAKIPNDKKEIKALSKFVLFTPSSC